MIFSFPSVVELLPKRLIRQPFDVGCFWGGEEQKVQHDEGPWEQLRYVVKHCMLGLHLAAKYKLDERQWRVVRAEGGGRSVVC